MNLSEPTGQDQKLVFNDEQAQLLLDGSRGPSLLRRGHSGVRWGHGQCFTPLETPQCPAVCRAEVHLIRQREGEWGHESMSLGYWKKLTHWCQMELDSNSEPLTTFVSLSTSLNLSEPGFLPVW